MSVAAETPCLDPRALDGAALTLPGVCPDPLPLKRIEASPCTLACPAGVNVKAYVSLIADRRFTEALEVVRRRCPLPAVCGRVCHHPCEEACLRGGHDQPIAIRALKRFASDIETWVPAIETPPIRHAEKVAIIGSGPAGLTAAYDLRQAGYPVTVYEAQAQAGGMLRYGIAAYRLPRDILDREIAFLLSSGIELRTGARLGDNLELDRLMQDGCRAVLLAVGAQFGRPLNIPGASEHDAVEDALAFLVRVNRGEHTPVRGKVLVVGGGSTAIEAARTALRLGAAAVEIVYRRSRSEMPAAHEELAVAEAEGVTFRFLTTPSRVVSRGSSLAGLECRRVALGEPDASGRRRPVDIPDSEFFLEADRVLAAVGQEADLDFLPSQIKRQLAADGRLQSDPHTGRTQLTGFFAAGDVASGPATVIEAIAAGHRAAQAIARFLQNGEAPAPARSPALPDAPEYQLPELTPTTAPRCDPPVRAVLPGAEFDEVELALTTEQAVAEAGRCLRCGPCEECEVCAGSCPRRHVTLTLNDRDGGPGPTVMVRSSLAFTGTLDDRAASGRLVPGIAPGQAPDSAPAADVALQPAVVRIHDARCRGCGDCLEVCTFDALRLVERGDGEQLAVLDPSACRGCGLCAAVCPTEAVVCTAMPEWWRRRLQDVQRFASSSASPALPCVVLACERRAGVFDPMLERGNLRAEVVRLRCAGQINAGMLLQLYQHGARRLIIAGCRPGRCRFGEGSRLAERQAQLASGLIQQLGGGADCVACDWSAGPQDDCLEPTLRRHMAVTRTAQMNSPSTPEQEVRHGAHG